jgi:hypothetical protein
MLRKPAPLIWVLLLVTLVVGLLASSAVNTSSSWGWDESMHAGLPAMRMAEHMRALEPLAAAQVAVECQQYPFVVPAVWAAANVVFSDVGSMETFGRHVGRWGLVLLALGAALLGRELVRAVYERDQDDFEEWFAALVSFGLVITSPLVVDYSGSWFLEVPFACVATWSVWAWLVRLRLRAEPGAWRRDLVCGGLLTVAFFTKFNYGLLLGLGAFLALLWEALGVFIAPARALWPSASNGRAWLVSVARLAVLPALGFVWWFGLPLPGDAALAASHREALRAFLAGNQQLVRTPDAQRLMHWGVYAVQTPRVLGLLLAGLGMLVWIARRRAPVIAVWLIWLCCLLPIVLHNFHLDRFLVLPLVMAIPLAAVGLLWMARLSARGHAGQGALWVVPGLLALASVAPSWDGQKWFAATVGFADKPEVVEYQKRVLANYQDTDFDRKVSTAGLDQVAADTVLDAVAQVVLGAERPALSFGWLGISSELSPAALYAGVYARAEELGRPRPLLARAAETRGDGNPKMVMTFEGLDPGWNDDQLIGWARSFDVLFTTVPPDFRDRGNRKFLSEYQTRLIGSGQVDTREIAAVQVPQPFGPPKLVKVFALTPIK